MLATSAWPRTLPLVRPFTSGTASQPSHRLLRPRLTSRSGSTPLPFQAQGEISPGKNALLHCTAAGSTPLPLDHESFAVSGPLALVSTAFYPVLVHQPAASLHASSPHSVALMQLRFASLVVINSRWDLHPQECAHAGRTKKTPGGFPPGVRSHIARAPDPLAPSGGISGGSLYALSQLPSPVSLPYMPPTHPRMTAGAQKSHKCRRDETWHATF
jgi:hypothetical protein